MPGKKNKKTPGIGNETLPHLFLGLKALADSKAKYIIVGGIATNLHGLSTATKDIDVLIPKDLENTEKILKGLENLGWGLSKELFAEDVIKKPFTIIGDQPRVDLLLIAGKINFEQAYPNREQKTIEGIKIPYLNTKRHFCE